VPTVLQWSQGGGAVFVTGSFNHWGERIPLRRSGGDFVVCLNLLPGTYQYKFIVDNEWRYATDQQTVRDQMGNINNCLTVEDQAIYLHEDPQSGFFGNNPAQAYTQALPDEITLAKEPPNVPAHLAVLPLNMHPIAEPRIASWSMHPPLTVTLQHICMLRNATSTTLSCTYAMPHVTRHTSHVTRHTPHATRHTPHATRHTPHATRHATPRHATADAPTRP
jgi:5'-AMP-activated protein kinase regulatory beta subunit